MKQWTREERQDVLTRLAAGETGVSVAASYGREYRGMMRTVYGWRARGSIEDRRKTVVRSYNCHVARGTHKYVPAVKKLRWLAQEHELHDEEWRRTRRAYLKDREVQIHRTYHETLAQEGRVPQDLMHLYAMCSSDVQCTPALNWQRLKLPRPRITWRPTWT